MDLQRDSPGQVYGSDSDAWKVINVPQEAAVPWSDDCLFRPLPSPPPDQTYSSPLNAGKRPTAVLAIADIMPLAFYRRAAAIGLRMPDDLAVIGFDDIPQANVDNSDAHHCSPTHYGKRKKLPRSSYYH